ncbi:MAG TPA: tetratricopeptide repeat protein [Verrucomicrobiae bacterium]|jgi:tetratricopeptide (TPR) repeat protein
MVEILSGIVLVLLVMAATWWLSGFDTGLSGDDTRIDYLRRGLRCGFTWLLMVLLLLLPGSAAMVPVVALVGGILALVWGWCVGECVARGFHVIIGMASSNREFDPRQHTRNLEMLAILLREGRRAEALELAETLKASGDANVLAVETLLERAGIPQESAKKIAPLAEADRLHLQGKFDEAETILKSLLAQNPSNADAALMLMRLYVQDFRRSDKAMEVLRSLEKQPHASVSHIEYAMRSIQEWGRVKIVHRAETLPESVDELIAAGYLGTAIETVERETQEQPKNFDAQLKLAEIYAMNSDDLQRAEKIVKKIETSRVFNDEQIERAKAKLAGWREAKAAAK